MHTEYLWKPSQQQLDAAVVTDFIKSLNRPEISDFHSLYDWSISEQENFWQACWNYFEIITSQPPTAVVENAANILESRWFPGARLNFAENLMRYNDDRTALSFWGEDKKRATISYKELHRKVAKLHVALREHGLKKSDRVAALVPNMPESIIAMLATSSLGAIWSSASPDFGVNGVYDRFGQIEPKVLFTCDAYFYKGKVFSCMDKIAELERRIPSIETVVVVPYVDDSPDISMLSKAVHYAEFVGTKEEVQIQYEPMEFSDPLFIMFSSGTTGKPKCIVHGVGGPLIETIKEHRLHLDLKATDTIFYATTCGWMMWNWLTVALASGAKLVLYDGFPFLNEGRILWDLVEQEQVSVFGTSAAYITALNKQGLKPKDSHQLDSLRSILSTGSVLVPESFDYVYRDIKKDLCLSSISGGTDILGCFALGASTLPVYRGQLQTRSLGYKVEVFSPEGNALKGQKGELVCTNSFPSMPICFWNDKEQVRYRKAYFSRFENVWHHGDYVELTDENGMIFYGRSDATLNPGGVRIGTAEIYRQLEQRTDILQAVVVGQPHADSERVVLFVVMKTGLALTEELISEIKKDIRSNVSPRHVPAVILSVPDIPVTRSGKISELTIKRLIANEEPENTEALKNPESLEYYRNLDI